MEDIIGIFFGIVLFSTIIFLWVFGLVKASAMANKRTINDTFAILMYIAFGPLVAFLLIAMHSKKTIKQSKKVVLSADGAVG